MHKSPRKTHTADDGGDKFSRRVSEHTVADHQLSSLAIFSFFVSYTFDCPRGGC